MIERVQIQEIIERLQEPRRTIQVVAGPRQVGKTTMVKQALQQQAIPFRFLNADGVDAEDNAWIAAQWEEVRAWMRFNGYSETVLAIDEIHKINNWSEQVKREWDADTFNDLGIKVVLLGSSRLLLKKGLTESLAGRFEIIPMGHWSFAEMQEAFGWDINQYIYFGGYPGSAPYIKNEARWRRYMREAIISPAIEKDVLQTTYIYKPALMHQLFRLGCAYSGELLSYNKMLGMLQDAGNATTLVNYMEVLGESKLLTGLPKYVMDASRKYRTIPKLQVFNNGLLTALSEGATYEKVVTDPKRWGRWVESAVGCYLLDKADELEYTVYYWRENNEEVDFVIRRGDRLLAIEVKSGRRQMNSGVGKFREQYRPQHTLMVGGDAMPVEQLFKGDIGTLL
ncbi:MAG: ATP-binding protein [Paludibacteraceae bacterium]|nr:ATP-binding protein [Paludibacteraceae bacterium]